MTNSALEDDNDDSDVFDAVLREASTIAEVDRAVQRIADVKCVPQSVLTDRLRQHLRDRRDPFQALVAGEARRYAEAKQDLRLRSDPWSAASMVDIRWRVAVDDARQNLHRALLQKAVLPEARVWLTAVLEEDRAHTYRPVFDTPDTSGLRQMSAAEHEVATAAFEVLADLVQRIGGGAIGISGPRGAGKSTLLKSATASAHWLKLDGPRIGVVVPAPVEYVAREFVLHLHASLCRRVLQEVHGAAVDEDLSGQPPRPRAALTGLAVTLVIGGVLGVAAPIASSQVDAGGVLAAGVLVSVAAAGAYLTARRRLAHPPWWRSRWERVADRVLRSPAGVLLRTLWLPVRVVIASLVLVRDFLRIPRFPERSDLSPEALTFLALGLAGAGVLAYRIIEDPGGDFVSLSSLGAAGTVGLVGIVATPVAWGRAAGLGLLLTLGLMGTLAARGDVVPEGYAWAALTYALALVSFRVGFLLQVLRGTLTDHWASTLMGETLVDTARGAIAVGMWLTTVSALGWHSSPGIAGAALLVAGGVALTSVLAHRSLAAGDHAPEDLVLKCREVLRSIRYQQTVTRGWSEAVKLGRAGISPLGVEVGATGSNAFARVPWTYPEAVASFHDFVSFLVNHDYRVVVGIDELDKLGGDAAARFLNDIKAVFDGTIPGCYYLVTVSEEALASFQQRGLPTRDVFDSAFDEMLNVDYLDYDGTRAMLARRVIDLPRGLVVLCHALSGGLPRDVIRTLRVAVAIRAERRTGPLSMPLGQLSAAVCERELGNRLHGLQTQLRELPNWRDLLSVGDWARCLRMGDIRQLQEAPALLPVGGRDADRAALRLLRNHAASFYHLTTVCDVLGRADEEQVARLERGGVEELARARRTMAVSWALAMRDLTAFRREHGLVVPSLTHLGMEPTTAVRSATPGRFTEHH